MKSLFVAVVLVAMLVSQSTAQPPFRPEFPHLQYVATESGQEVIYLSAPTMTESLTPPFNGSIEVDVTAEDDTTEFGRDYLINLEDTSSRIFTVVFQSKQANSTEHVIQLADDDIYEGSESFRLRIVAVRFVGQAADLFTVTDGLNNTYVNIIIEDDDIIKINWTISDAQVQKVTEGEEEEVSLTAQAFGVYAIPITIEVMCTGDTASDREPARLGDDFHFTPGTKLNFTHIGDSPIHSFLSFVVPIIDDNIAEPCESFICTLQGGAAVDVDQNGARIKICDDDPLIVHWAKDVYEFTEGEIATVELVTDSNFEVDQVSIEGLPRQIHRIDTLNYYPALLVPGPIKNGFLNNASIERAVSNKFGGRIVGNAQVAQSGRPDVERTTYDFVFTPASKSAFKNFTIFKDDVLEFDELFIAEFDFGSKISNTWNTMKGDPSIAFILIRDNDYVEVNFNESSYTVAERNGHVNVSLRIDGKFFVPVWAVVEISDGTATDPEDYSSAVRYNVTFRQTAYSDEDDPDPTALSEPILIDIVTDYDLEDVEYFQARIVETSDVIRVRIGQDIVNVTIIDRMVISHNDTIVGDPLYEVPVIVDGENNKTSLCFEVHGEANQTFNLISDTCVSVNALYSAMFIPVHGNIISKVGVLAEDSSGVCQQIEADLEGCTARVNGNNVTMYNQDGIRVMRRTNRIRISVPNCNRIPLVMWVICEVREQQPMIKFVVARGFNLSPTSHGLIGQFWNIPVEAERYNVTAEDKIPIRPGHYAVTVNAPSGTRRFFAVKDKYTWDMKRTPCLYSGNTQAGQIAEVTSLSDTVIEGSYDEYKVSSLFATEYNYNMFHSKC